MRRSFLGTLVAAAVAAAVLVPLQPASAFTDPQRLSIALGEHKLVKKDAVKGASASFQAAAQTNAYPADCDTDPVGCEVVPLDLVIPEEDPDAIEAQAYLLTVKLSWDCGASVDNLPEVGTARQNDLEGYLYQDPNVRNSSGTATYTAQTHGNCPGTMTAVAPTSKKFNIVVANYSGVNNGYTLEISLIKSNEIVFDPGQYTNHKTPDYVQPTFTPPAGTPHQNGFGGATLPPMNPGSLGGNPNPAVAGSGPIVVPNIPAGNADATLLAMSKVIRATGLGLHSVKVDSTVAVNAVADNGTSTVLLTLLALPVLAVVVALVLLARRRKGLRATGLT